MYFFKLIPVFSQLNNSFCQTDPSSPTVHLFHVLGHLILIQVVKVILYLISHSMIPTISITGSLRS